MIIDIADILLEPGSFKDFQGEMNLDDIDYQGEPIAFEWPVHIKGNVVNAGDFIALTAHIKGKAVLQCNVCIEPYDYLLDNEIQVNLKSLPDEEDPDIYVYSDNLIKLNEIVTREFILKLPIQRRCIEGCKGLCSICGINLNKQKCQCSHEEEEEYDDIDERLVILKDLIVDVDREV